MPACPPSGSMASSLRSPSPLLDCCSSFPSSPAPILASDSRAFPVPPAARPARDGGSCGAMAKCSGWNRARHSCLDSGSFFRQAIKDSASLFQLTVKDQETEDEEYVPTPIVVIDQESDPDATVVELSFGDRLGALLDTMKALTDLGLNVVKSRISVEGPVARKRFAITRADTGRKITDPELLEAIRLTIINNMLTYHPESSVQLALGTAFGTKSPTKKLDIDIATHIHIYDDGPDKSLLFIETADRPGLLRDILKIITDVNISFDSGEFDTEGLMARAKFHVSYRGTALSKSMKEVMTNCLQYFIRRPETNEDSY